MCFKKRLAIVPVPPPVIIESATITMTRQEFLDVLAVQGVTAYSLVQPLDSIMRFATKAELDRIAPELVYPASNYLVDLWDCEDYALQAQCDAGRKFEVSVRLVIGDMPLGKHGFCITLDTEKNIWLLENNAGFPYAGKWFKISENGYIPQLVLI
jgi:hypothetical protein